MADKLADKRQINSMRLGGERRDRSGLVDYLIHGSRWRRGRYTVWKNDQGRGGQTEQVFIYPTTKYLLIAP